MASIAPITDVLTGPVAPASVTSGAAAQTTQASPAPAASAAQVAAQAAAQPPDFIFDALALDSAFDETLFTSTAVEGTGAFSAFMGELFAALAAQQAVQQQTAAASTTSPPLTAAPQPAAAAAEFASNAPSTTPNSAFESNVQALANQVQAANNRTTNAPDTGAPSPLQQTFEEFIASAGGTTTANSLPTFLQSLADNLHSVPSPLGNLVNSQT